MYWRRLAITVSILWVFAFLSHQVCGQTPLTSFPPGYVTVDPIQPGTIGGWLSVDNCVVPGILDQTEIVSPFDGSTAIRQSIHFFGFEINQGFLSRNYQLGYSCPNGTKVAFYTSIDTMLPFMDDTLPFQSHTTEMITLTFFKGNTVVGRKSCGLENWNPPEHIDYPLPNHFAGIVEIEANGLTEPFDNFTVTLGNRCFAGASGIIFDELRIQPPTTTGDSIQFSESPTYILIGKDEQSSGVVLRAKTSAPTTVVFKANGVTLGSVPTVDVNGSNMAKYIWMGDGVDGNLLPDGSHTVSASAFGKTESLTCLIKRIPTLVIGFKLPPNGVFDKDPSSSIYPEQPKCVECITSLTDDMANSQKGYVSGIFVDDPVNIVSGNYTMLQADLRLRSRIPLVLSRIYNSLDMSSGLFGRGWSCPYQVQLNVGVSTASLKLSDGSKVLFTKQGDAFVSSADSGLNLVFSSDTGFWSVTNPRGAEWTFDTAGKIIRMARACCGKGAADATLLEYGPNGRLTKVTNPAGQYFQFTTNDNGQITTVKDSDGRVISYSYDDKGHLVSFTDPANRVTRYSYNTDGFMTSVTKPGAIVTAIGYTENRVASITTPNGSISTFDWASGTERTVTLTDTKGIKHTYSFDDSWNLASYSLPTGGVEKGFTASGALITEYRDGNGAKTHFEYDDKGLMTSKIDSLGNVWRYEYHPKFRTLTKTTDPMGRVWSYSWCSKGNLISRTDPLGNKITYKYDQWNNRISETDPLGRVSKYEYDSNGNKLLRIVDPLGGVVSFSYDSRGNLLTATDQLGRVTRFEYDKLDRLTKTTFPDRRYICILYSPEGRIAARIDNLGRRAEYTYDAKGNLLSTKRPDGSFVASEYDAAGHLVSATDALGYTTKFNYNDADSLIEVVHSDSSTRTFEYDADKRLISEKNELGAQTRFQYDSEGRLTATIDPAGNRWESIYDPAGRVIAEKDPLNRRTSFTYDALSRVVKVERADGTKITNEYDAVGNLVKTTDANGATWTWQYDALDRQIRSIRPDGASTTILYDAVGQVLSIVDPLGRAGKTTYDAGGRPMKVTTPTGAVWQYNYDQAGRLISVTNPLGAVAKTSYDLMNRIVTRSDPLGNTTRFEYDVAGRRVAVVDPLGRRSIASYDARNRVIGEADPEGRNVSYGYDLGGRRTSLTDGFTRTWRWEYDQLDRVIAQVDPAGDMVKFAYDPLGNCTSKVNARGQSLSYEYDVMSRLSKVRYPNGTIATFSYDPGGREVARSSASGWVKKTWGSIGELASEKFGPYEKGWRYQYDLVGNRIKAISPENDTFKYEYDQENRLTKLLAPGCKSDIRYSYDLANRLTGMSKLGVISQFSYDKAGRLLELRHDRETGRDKLLALRKYTYNAKGQRVSVLDEENGLTTYRYDNSGWLIGVTYPDKEVASYTYNGAGDRVKETIGKSVVNYSYDPAGRMLQRGKDTFEYDADGNMVRAVESGLETEYTWSPDNRLLKVEREIPCHKHFLFHCRKCAKKVEVAEEYTYYPEDWRLMTRKSGDTTFFSVYDGADESHEYIIAPKIFGKGWRFGPHCWKPKLPQLLPFREFISGPGADDIEITRYHGRDLAMLKDSLGSTIALANRGGNVAARIGYDAWGNLRWPDKKGHSASPCKEDDLCDVLDRLEGRFAFGGASHDCWHYGRHFAKSLTPYLYAGRRVSPVTGLYFNRNRHYKPAIGRFLSSDPIGFDGGSNLWNYGGNNPISNTDPYGLSSIMDQMEAQMAATRINVGAFNQTVSMNNSAYNNTTGMNVPAYNETLRYMPTWERVFHDMMSGESEYFKSIGGSLPSLFKKLTSSLSPASTLEMIQSTLGDCDDPLNFYYYTDVGSGHVKTLEEWEEEFNERDRLEAEYEAEKAVLKAHDELVDKSNSEEQFLDNSLWLLLGSVGGQAGKTGIKTASDIVKKLIGEGKVRPKDLEFVTNQIENVLRNFGPDGFKPNAGKFNSLIRQIMEEAAKRLGN